MIRCCQRCAGLELHMPGAQDGFAPGFGQEMLGWSCGECELTAVALEFEEEADYLAFRAERRARKS